MLRIGVDMVEVARIQESMDRYGERFYARFFTPTEREQARDIPSRLAARFAAKEAVSKALGTGIGPVSWVEIEVRLDEIGRPHLALHGAAARLADELELHSWQVSLSHTQEHAIAFVVATQGIPF